MAQTKETVLTLQHFLISCNNRKARVEFAKMHLHWRIEEWRKILFSHDSKFNLKGCDSKHKCIRRPPNKRLPNSCKGTVKQWCECNSVGLFFTQRNIVSVWNKWNYDPLLLQKYFGNCHVSVHFFFQHDNDPELTSKYVESWIQDQKINIPKMTSSHEWCEKLNRNPDWRVVMAHYVCM